MKLTILPEDVEKARNNQKRRLPVCESCVVSVAAQRQWSDPSLVSNLLRVQKDNWPLETIAVFKIPAELAVLMQRFDFRQIDGQEMIGQWEERK